MSDTTNEPTDERDSQDSGTQDSGTGDAPQVPSTEQDVASGQPYDPRQDPGPSGQPQTSGQDSDGEQSYDPRQDPDSDPDMLQDKSPADQGVNERDPAEGADDASAVDH